MFTFGESHGEFTGGGQTSGGIEGVEGVGPRREH